MSPIAWTRPMARGSLARTGGIRNIGDKRSGISSSQTRATPSCVAASSATSRNTAGRWQGSMTEYVELHSASAFSFLEGASQPEALIERATELGMHSLALTDRNGVYGAARFHTAGKRAGSQAHVGAEIAVASFGPRLAPPKWLPHQFGIEPARVSLLCESQIGYQNLCQLTTRFKLRERGKAEGSALLRDLQEFSGGLVCLTGGDEGPWAAALVKGGAEAGRETLEKLISVYG